MPEDNALEGHSPLLDELLVLLCAPVEARIHASIIGAYLYWATISYSSPSVSHSNSSISAPYFLQRAHVLGFVEEAGGPDFIVNLNAVGEEPSVRGVKQHFAAQQCFEAAPAKADEDLVPTYVGSHGSTPAKKSGATPAAPFRRLPHRKAALKRT